MDGSVFSGFRGSADLILAACFWLGVGVFSGFIVSADLILSASFSQAEKEEQVGGLAFELEAGAGLAHGFGPWAVWGWATGWFEGDCGFLKWGLMVFGHGCAALNPGWRLVELALPWAKICNPYRVEFVPTKHTHPLPGREGICRV